MTRLTQAASNDNDNFIDAIARELSRAVNARAAHAPFAEREQAALEVSNEAVRRLLESELQKIADAEGEQVDVETETYRRHQPGDAKYHSLCGPLRVSRWTYRLVGVRNGTTIVPLELRAGLIENATPALAFAVTQGYAKAPIRSVRQDLEAARRSPPSRATLERMAKSIGTDAKKDLMRIERSVRAEEELPKRAKGITIGMDRTTIPMEEPITPPDDDGRRVEVKYRMCYVGTVAITDTKGDVLASWRYASAAHEGPLQVVRRIMNDVRKALTAKPRLHVGVVQDGAPELWSLVTDALREEPRVRKWHEAIDMFHLFERLSAALQIVEPDERERRAQLSRWKREFLRDDGTIARVMNFFELDLPWLRARHRRWRKALIDAGCVFLRNHCIRLPLHPNRPSTPIVVPHPPHRWTEKQRNAVSDILYTYVLNPRPFRYATLARLGLHVGSGVTEGACKSLIAVRAKRSGQRWSKTGIAAVLALRSLVQCDRFTRFWNRFVRRYAPLADAA
jgi:hypothetical protein